MSDLFSVQQGAGTMARGSMTTKLSSVGGKSKSLRTVVPMWIVEHFGLKVGSKLEWKFVIDGEKMTIKVSPEE
mgnify:FL=1